MFLEHWNRKKILSNIRQRFSCLIDEWVEIKCKKKQFVVAFHLKSTLLVLRCTWTGRINLKTLLGYDIKYLSIWPFVCHPWFSNRKASKNNICLFSACRETNVCLLSSTSKLKDKYWFWGLSSGKSKMTHTRSNV